MAAAARRPPPSRSAQGAAATPPALLCSLPFPPHCSTCGVGDRGDNPDLEAERIPGFFQFARPALRVLCGCSAPPASLARRRLHFFAAAATTTLPCGQCHPSGASQEAALPSATRPLEGADPAGMGAHIHGHQHTGAVMSYFRHLWAFLSIFILIHMRRWYWLSNLGTIYLCVCLHRHTHHLENPIALECFLAENRSTWAYTYILSTACACPCQSSRTTIT